MLFVATVEGSKANGGRYEIPLFSCKNILCSGLLCFYYIKGGVGVFFCVLDQSREMISKSFIVNCFSWQITNFLTVIMLIIN